MLRFITKETVIKIHDDQIRLYGGLYGVRDSGLLDSAVNTPKAQFGGRFLHPMIHQMAAAYLFHLCQNHPFIDGNKRVARMVMITFLRRNRLVSTASEFDYYYVTKEVANGKMSKQQVADWLETAIIDTLLLS